jgi:hypothetical protein
VMWSLFWDSKGPTVEHYTNNEIMMVDDWGTGLIADGRLGYTMSFLFLALYPSTFTRQK